MDEYDRGTEPEMQRYLKKVLNSLFVGLFWMIFMAIFGIYLEWGFPHDGVIDGINIFFYALFLLTLSGLIWYYYRLWK